VAPPRLPSRANLARFGAPAAFLAGVTVAVLVVRAGLSASDGEPTATITATTATTTAEQPRFYTIERGDTFGSVAAEFDTSVDRLRELNPDVDETMLTIGQRIRVE
jgi:LysM repeat protein